MTRAPHAWPEVAASTATLRRVCAAATLLLGLLALTPPVLLSDDDGLPAFDDNDEDSVSFVVVGSGPAVLPNPAPRLSALRVVAALVGPLAVPVPESCPPETLPSRAPPRS